MDLSLLERACSGGSGSTSVLTSAVSGWPTPEELAALACLLPSASLDAGLPADALQYFGRVSGSGGDYLIASAWAAGARVFFRMRSAAPLALVRLPPAPAPGAGAAGAPPPQLLTGDPAALRAGSDETEDARLAALLARIDAECGVVPAAAFARAAAGGTPAPRGAPAGLLRADDFAGVPPALATALASYARLPRLDSLADAPPAAQWRATAAAAAVTLRCAAWPGYLFWHAPGTADWGAVYHGDGRRDDDAVFAA